jgi:hypothetical protein
MADLGAASLYEREIQLLAERGRLESGPASAELSAPLVALHAAKVARMLAAEVSAGRYEFAPLVPHAAMLNGKPRTIYRIDPLDAVVLGVLTRVLAAVIEPRLGDQLYSYRKGCSQWSACRALLRYLREHCRARPDPRTRGLFVLRRDVRRYDENIPVGDDSTLWTTLRDLLAGAQLGMHGDLHAFLRRAFRPLIAHPPEPDGAQLVKPLERGVPTGLPTQTIACNTYLLPLDVQLAPLGGFYARFGDDMLFAHPEQSAAEEAARRLDAGLHALGLRFNPDKSCAYWLTRPGRAHANAAGFTPVARLPYLGFDVGFDGARLRADKRRVLWRALRARIDQADRLFAALSEAERAEALCSVVATAFDPRSPLCDRYASWLRFDVMSLGDLKQLDHQLALTIAERLSGLRGVRAFRRFPPQALYQQHGLPSLVRAFARARGSARTSAKTSRTGR